MGIEDLAKDMSALSKELVFVILQLLEEEKFTETLHMLEKESGFYFNMSYFEDIVAKGDWDEVENYLSGFMKVEDNRYSTKIFFEVRKLRYLEALDKRDLTKAVEILRKDLKVFSALNEDVYKELTLLLRLEDYRENELLSKYGDTKAARAVLFVELKKLIEANPLFHDKLKFPDLKSSRLRSIINQSLNWQHQRCKSPKSNPEITSLFVDHTCGQPNGARDLFLVTNSPMGSMSKVNNFSPLGPHGPFQVVQTPLPMSVGGWKGNPSSVPHEAIAAGLIGATSNLASSLKRPRTSLTNNIAVDCRAADSEHVLKRSRAFGSFKESASSSYDDLPKTVVANLIQGSAVKSMEFHPLHHTFLLVGTNIGDVAIWDVGTQERIILRNFKVWEIEKHTMTLQASLANDYSASVNKVTWSPEGTLFGVAYSKHIVHVYSYHGDEDMRNHLELDAHVGNVNDIAFSSPNKKLCILTCGEDKAIKVWDVASGTKLYFFDGHEAPVYSLCPHVKEDVEFFFSTDIDGKIKAWLYDTVGPRVNYDAPGHSCTTMAYNADRTRLFSCGTTKEGESLIVEWNEGEGSVTRTYNGLGERSVGVVQFDTTDRFLAAGDDFAIKFWDMDNVNILASTDADGGLAASPTIRFNKGGLLLAVSSNDNGVKILANTDGAKLIQSLESRTLDDSSIITSGTAAKAPVNGTLGPSSSALNTNVSVDRNSPVMAMVSLSGDGQILPEMMRRTADDVDGCKVLKLTKVNEPYQLRSLRLPDKLLSVKISRLIYTNSGGAILALQCNAVHKLWKWPKDERNVVGKANTDVPPQLWLPSSGILMTNDISEANPEEAISCFGLSKNDSYLMSASGGKISLFNMMTFKTMTTFMTPPPAATFLAFHPLDNNIIAIGMEDSTIQIYNVRMDEVNIKLIGHLKRVTGLAFSQALHVLVSSGADDQLCIWDMNGWKKQESKFLHISYRRNQPPHAQTRVQFHRDQVHLLVVHESQLAIYEAPKLACIKQWVSRDSRSSITDATYSCDSTLIYASFEDGSVSIFNASTLGMNCRISSSAYLPLNPRSRVYPLVVAAHPSEPNQFALALSDGGVHVIEPLKEEGKWGTMPLLKNGAGPNVGGGSDEPTR